MKTFKQMTDARLSSLAWNTDEGMRSLRRSQPAPRSLRRPLVAAVAMVLALAAAGALAVGMRLSQQVEVKRIAREAVMQTYGLDAKSLGLFSEHAAEEDGVWTVTYGGEWRAEEKGVYTVTVRRDGTAQASWSMEGAEGAWGQAEIAAYIRQKDEAHHAMVAQEAASASATAEPLPTPVMGARLSHAQAVEAADAALRSRYGFKDAGLAEFDAVPTFAGGLWTVEYTAFGWHWKDGYLSDKAGEYHVTVDDASGAVTSVSWSLDGVDSGAYTRQNFGKARAYDAQCMEWVAEIRTQFEEAYTANETSRWPLSVEEMARLDGLMIGAGFDAAKYNHVVPAEGDLPLEAALELAAQALQSEYGVSRAVFDSCSFAYADLTQETGGRRWYFWAQSEELQMGWTIYIDAQSGEILDLYQESFAAGNG